MQLVISVKVTELKRAISFYTEKLGFECNRIEDNWAGIKVGDAEVHLYTEAGATGDIEFYVANIDKEVKRLSEKGVKFISGMHKANAIKVDINMITEFPWGRTAFFNDSEGNELALIKDF